MAEPLSFNFHSRVERLETSMTPHVIPVPDDVSDEFAILKIRRVIANLNGTDFRRAIQGPLAGGRYLVVGMDLLKSIDCREGSPVNVTLSPDPEPDLIEIPEELEIALEQDDAARSRWLTFPPGRQRSLCYHVSQAKRESTRIKRALELAEKIRTHSLYGDRQE